MSINANPSSMTEREVDECRRTADIALILTALHGDAPTNEQVIHAVSAAVDAVRLHGLDVPMTVVMHQVLFRLERAGVLPS